MTRELADAVKLAVIGGPMFTYAAWNLVRCARARHWPSIEGQVVGAGLARSRLVSRHIVDSGVVYRYNVGGQEYRGDRARFGFTPRAEPLPGVDDRGDWPRPERQLGRAYRDEAPVKVYINPRDPSESVLDPSPSLGLWVFAVLGAVMLVGAVVSFPG